METSAIGLAKRLANIEPHRFRQGENATTRMRAEREQLRRDLVAELGGDLTASDRLLLAQIIELHTRRSRDPEVRVRCANTAARLLDKLKASIKLRRDNAPLPSYAELMRK